jgi:fructose-1,6-bisphosphatase/inositol monophosphatase family enzyme
LLAEGKVEAVIETNLKPFDIVPLIPIIEKAGGKVSTWNNMSARKGGNILATSNIKLHSKILKILKGSIKS